VSNASNQSLVPGQKLNGYIVRGVAPLKNLRATAYQLEHEKSGAKLLHVHAQDSENLFCIAFKTPPSDDTGLPHILEHSVLGGSKKFPVKDPFKEMVNMSMATFINAMTYPDKTVYPVASNVKKDFFNLAEVYCDAVFHPKISRQTLEQEGHHLEFAKKGDITSDLIVKGIVFNEMKGAYSSADDYVDNLSFLWLFPNSPYGKDSGGDPDAIPDLTYDAFTSFHKTLYHPSNSFIFIFGDIPTTEHLGFLKDKLDQFKHKEVDTSIPHQRRWKEPKERVEQYPVGKDDETKGKTFVTMNWLVGDCTDPQEVMALTLLDLILLGNEAAPLKKALIDSKLGDDLTRTGYSAYVMEGTFHVGLKGTEADRKAKIVKLVMDTLKKVADEGIPEEKVEAAFHQLGYRFFEIQSMFPLWLMDRAYRTWIYGADPLAFLRADEHLEALKAKYHSDKQLFSRLIKLRLLENPHRLDCVFTPDREMQGKKDAKFAAKMKKLKSGMKPAQLKKIAQEAAKLEKLQNTPNSPAALLTLPQLKVKDLPAKPKHIPTVIEKLSSGVEVLRNDVFANGVNYLHLDFDIADAADELFPFMPLFGDCVHKMGAAGLDYTKMAERVVANTGGIGFWTSVSTHAAASSRCLRRARFSLKALDGKIGDALKVFRDVLFELEFRDEARLKDVLIQSKAAHRSALVSSGLDMAMRHAGRRLSPEGQLSEMLGGLPQTRLVEKLADHYAAEREATVAKLEQMRALFRNSKRVTASFTGSDGAYTQVTRALDGWCREMGSAPIPERTPKVEKGAAPRDGLATPAEVAFCAQVLPAPHVTHADAPILNVGARLLSLGFLWEEIRIKGGAYGGGCGYNGFDRDWYFYSYRDPSIKKTLDTFGRALDYARNAKWSKTDVDRAIIGTAKGAERPIRPGEATGQALNRHVMGDSPEAREARHARLLEATPKNVKASLVELLEANTGKGGVCVVSSREKLEAANKEMPGAALSIEDIMK